LLDSLLQEIDTLCVRYFGVVFGSCDLLAEIVNQDLQSTCVYQAAE